MTNSPYDNLPSGKSEAAKEASVETLEYIDVKIEDEPTAKPAPASKPVEPAECLITNATPQNSKPSAKQSSTKQSAAKQPATRPQNLKPIQNQQHTHLSISNLGPVQYFTLPFEETLLVPDTMPDMHNVLFAEGKPVLSQPSKTTYSANDFISGDITVYTVYRPQSAANPADVIKSSIPFKTDKCWESSGGESFKVTVRIKSIRSEMINERKFAVKGELLLTITAIMQNELNLFKRADDSSLVCYKSCTQATGISFELKETTEISQEINVAADQPAPVKILKESIHITETHRQITSGKLVINAVIHSHILYSGLKDDAPQLAYITNKTDFTQFIPVNEGADINLIRMEFDDSALKLSIENQNQFLISGSITTYIYGCQNIEIETIGDAYHKTHEIHCDSAAHEIFAVTDTISGEISTREVISIDDAGSASQNRHSENPANETALPAPHTLLCGCAEINEITAYSEHAKIIVEGSVTIKILALDEDSKAFVIEREVPVRGSLEASSTVENLIPDIKPSLKNFWFDKINLRQIEANISIGIEVWLKRKSQPDCIENIYIDETAPAAKPVGLAVYITGSSDTLWYIAKKYKTDTDTLAAVNKLDASLPLAEGLKLLIAHI